MKRAVKILLIIAVIYLATVNLCAEYELVEIIPGFNYGEWYKTETGYTPNASWFGAWIMAPRNDELFIGFGTARPAESDGGLLAKWNGDTLVPLGQFDEQGVHCLLWNKDTLYGIGSDPSRGDGWDGGNFYKYNSIDGFKKIRYNESKKPVLPKVVHSWGFCIDTINSRFYMATGSYDPVQYSINGNNCGNAGDSTLACYGEIWQSSDYGYSWELISGKKPDVISTFRAMDVIMFNNEIYEFNANAFTPANMKKSSDNGQTWTVISGVNPYVLWRMCVFQNKLVAGANVAKKLYVIEENANSSTITIPGALNYSFNVFANAGDRYLFTYFSDGSVYATPNLNDWIEIIPASGKIFLSIAYWEKEKSIVLAERDSIGKIWRVDISELLSNDVGTLNDNKGISLSMADGILTISNIEVEEVHIDLFNLLGINITKSVEIIENTNNINIDISKLPRGIYIILLNINGKNKSIRIIK